jgi:DNA processing protein
LARKNDPPVQAHVTPAPLPQARLDGAQRLACLRLIRSENIGPVTFRELINLYGGATDALEALPELSRRAGRKLVICPRDRAEAELEDAERVGAKPLFTIEPGYPAVLAVTENPPPLLYVKGDPSALQRHAVAIVGSRDASAAGQKLARLFAARLGEQGLVVVSGLARGIDGVAHRASLATGTVAVLAGGIDHIYPPEHADLYAEIAAAGCLVSEMPPGFRPRGQDFPRRNRIIAGISRGVIVIEAAKRSGTLTTARHAGEMGREVFAVPGHPLDPRAEGTNQLLRDGATLATRPEDVLEALGPQIGGPFPRHGPAEPDRIEEATEMALSPPPAPVSDTDAANAVGQVLAALGPAPVNLDELVRSTGLAARTVQAAVLELSLAGRIERHGGQLLSLKESGGA